MKEKMQAQLKKQEMSLLTCNKTMSPVLRLLICVYGRRLLDLIRTFITVKLDLPLLGLLLQRLVHLTTRSKLKDEIDPERKSC